MIKCELNNGVGNIELEGEYTDVYILLLGNTNVMSKYFLCHKVTKKLFV